MISESLGKVAAKGAAFLTALTFVKKLLGVARNIILARLLAPEDFGLFALAMILIEGMDSLTYTGVNQYLIQKRDIDDSVVGNVWLLNIIRGVVVTLLALAVCPLYSSLVNEPGTLQMLRIVAFIPLMEGLKNPGSILVERAIQFGRISIYETICVVLEVTVVSVMAWFIRDAEALAWGLLFGMFLKSLLSYFFFSPPKFPKFDLSRQMEILSAAKHFIIISIGTLIMSQGDNLIIGTLQGKELLGIYFIAYELAVFPVLIILDIANRVAFPVFSSLQVEKKRLQAVLLNALKVQLTLIIPFVIVMGVFAQELITTLYGDTWNRSGPVLKVLMLVTLGKGLIHICVPYILGTGAFGFASRIKFVETLFFLFCVYMGTRYFGLIGAALGAGTVYMVAGTARLIFICRDSMLNFFSVIKYALLPTLSVIPGVLIAQSVVSIFSLHRILETCLILSIVCVSYVGFSFLLQRDLLDVFLQKILSRS